MPSLRAPVENEVTVKGPSGVPWVQWFSNIVLAVTGLQKLQQINGTIPLAKLTVGGTDGSITITNGVITWVDPT